MTSLNAFPAHHLRAPTGSQQGWVITKAQNERLWPGRSLEVPVGIRKCHLRATLQGLVGWHWWGGTLAASMWTHTSLGCFQNYLIKQYRCHP